MTAAETHPEPSKFQRFHAGLLRFCRHPASILVWFCLFSLIVKEQFPFSHYPMYSGWSKGTHYFYIADKDGPIHAKTVFKVSVPRIKKLYGGDNGTLDKVIDEKRKSTGKRSYEPTGDDHAEAGRRLLAKLRAGVPEKRLDGQLNDNQGKPRFHPDGRPLLVRDVVASDLTLVRVEILREGKEFITTESRVVTTDAADNIVSTAPAEQPST